MQAQRTLFVERLECDARAKVRALTGSEVHRIGKTAPAHLYFTISHFLGNTLLALVSRGASLDAVLTATQQFLDERNFDYYVQAIIWRGVQRMTEPFPVTVENAAQLPLL